MKANNAVRSMNVVSNVVRLDDYRGSQARTLKEVTLFGHKYVLKDENKWMMIQIIFYSVLFTILLAASIRPICELIVWLGGVLHV
jgi:hypothetical protein